MAKRRRIVKDPLFRKKRNVYVGDHRTSLSLEVYIWDNLDRLEREEHLSVDEICSRLEKLRDDDCSLTSLLRYLVHEVTELRPGISGGDSMEVAEEEHPFPSPFHVALGRIKRVMALRKSSR